jgi:hypothetical protein
MVVTAFWIMIVCVVAGFICFATIKESKGVSLLYGVLFLVCAVMLGALASKVARFQSGQIHAELQYQPDGTRTWVEVPTTRPVMTEAHP